MPPDRLVVLVSGSGTNLQALLDATGDPAYGARVVAVGADRTDIEGLRRADRFGVETFVHRVRDFPSRADWDVALAATVASYAPDLVVLAGFMKLVGPAFLPSTAAGPSTPTRRCRRRSPGCTGRRRRWPTA